MVDSFPLPHQSLDRGSGDGGRLDLLLSPDHLFILAPNNAILIRPTPPTTTPSSTTSLSLANGVACSAVAGNHTTHSGGILLCTTESQVLLLHWDSLLGEWERIVVSEGDGRIGSVAIVGEKDGRRLLVAAFKFDVVIIYVLSSVHLLTEPGPLLLESIQELARLDKSKEPTTEAHAFLGNDNKTLFLLGLSYPLSLKMWEVQLDSGKGRLLKQQSAGLSMKSIVATDLLVVDDDHFLLLASSEGAAEVFHLLPTGFTLINRFRLAEDIEPNEEQMSEWRVLGAKFYSLGESCAKEEKTVDEKHEDEEESEIDEDYDDVNKLPLLVPDKRPSFPQLLILTVTTRGLSLVNGKSGQILLLLPYHQLLSTTPHPLPVHEEGGVIVAMEAAVSVGLRTPNKLDDQPSSSTILAIHPLFSETIHLLNLDMCQLLQNAATLEALRPCSSLLTSDILQPKSVLRKRFKSPPKSTLALPAGRRKSHSRRLPLPLSQKRPAWVTKVRSRPSPPVRYNKKTASPSHNRSQSPVSNNGNAVVVVPLPDKGRRSWEEDGNQDPTFGDRLGPLQSGLMGGHSYLRLAMSHDGSLLASGGSQSPIALMRTRNSWESVRLFKDISKVTSLHFNFHSNLLLVGSNDGKTRVIAWRTGKELLSLDFSSKFNEHVHSQFYFMDKFVLQPQLSSLVLYALREERHQGDEIRVKALHKLQAATFPVLGAQSITALAAPNRFLSSGILTGLSNKGLELFDVNSESVALSIRSAHSKPIQCIRLNESPVGGGQTTHLSDLILTSAPTHTDPIKLWDLRTASPVLRLADVNSNLFMATARPAFSPCGRFIATGCEDNSLVIYDTRRMQSRHSVFGGLGSTVLDCAFDPKHATIWAACRNGCFWKFS